MKKLSPLFLLCLASAVSLNVMAAPKWFKNVTITSASHYWDGSYDVWDITWEDDLNTGCGSANNLKKASWWDRDLNTRWDIGAARLSPAMAAVAGNLKADINIDPSVCHGSYGAKFQGVRIHR